MTYLLTAIAFIVIFSILVLIHELGHFLIAKKAGIKVEEFGIGFPPKLFTLFKKGDTSYTVNWIPFGGFVRMLGEDTLEDLLIEYDGKKEKVSKKESEKIIKILKEKNIEYKITNLKEDPKSFQNKTKLQRTGVIIAGVVMNFLLALILFTIGYCIGLSPLTLPIDEVKNYAQTGKAEFEIYVTRISEESIMEEAGFQVLDRIIRVNGQKLKSIEDLQKIQKAEEENSYEIIRNGQRMTIKAIADEKGEIGFEKKILVSLIQEGSIAEKAGFMPLDQILTVNNHPLERAEQIIDLQKAGLKNTYSVLRDNEIITLTAKLDKTGKIGIGIGTDQKMFGVYKLYLPVHEAFAVGLRECVGVSKETVKMLGRVIVSIVAKFTVPEGVAGPIGIVDLTHKSVQLGFLALLQLFALLSISLAVINIMPFPALDGGRLLFIVYEIIFRKKANQKIETTLHIIGFLLLILLLVVVTFKDFLRLFGV